MKITKSTLKKIIKEELGKVLNEAEMSQSLMGFPKEDIDAIIMMLNAEYGGLSMTPGERMNKAVALLKHFKGDVEAAVVDPQVVLGDPKVA